MGSEAAVEPSLLLSGGSSGFPRFPFPHSVLVLALAACKESVLLPTRLETRTKESNMYASQWAH
ncbi:hypothetical protein A6K26_009870 [Gammaproteobacteria bacterium 2W06]|nr:hypothetical protein A6K26_009870 [Gammaproteobacteria bacterium 2W06]